MHNHSGWIFVPVPDQIQTRLQYNRTPRECLTIIWSVLKLRTYLKITRFTIQTDHDFLKWILSPVDATGRLACQCLGLFKFEFDVFRGAGIKNQAANALPRLQTIYAHTEPIKNDVPIAKIETNLLEYSKVHLENDHEAYVKVVGDSDYLREGKAPRIAENLQHQETKPSYEEAALCVATANAEYKTDKTD